MINNTHNLLQFLNSRTIFAYRILGSSGELIVIYRGATKR